MVTGKRAFDGDDVSDILGAVLIREPDWTRLPPTNWIEELRQRVPVR